MKSRALRVCKYELCSKQGNWIVYSKGNGEEKRARSIFHHEYLKQVSYTILEMKMGFAKQNTYFYLHVDILCCMICDSAACFMDV